MTCKHAPSGCNYPEGGCAGVCMPTAKPEALRLAKELREVHAGYPDEGPSTFSEASIELRRLHASEVSLKAEVEIEKAINKTSVLQVETLLKHNDQLRAQVSALQADAENLRKQPGAANGAN